MATNLYLAMTAAEIRCAPVLPSRLAWMACHFCPYSTGLSNLPEALPPGSVLMLNDSTPIRSHDPRVVCSQLEEVILRTRCEALILDFQRPPSEQAMCLAEHLYQALPCPVAVSRDFAEDLPCPVLLPPCPPYMPLQEYIAPWGERQLWLELSKEAAAVVVRQNGTQFSICSGPGFPESGFSEETLQCHYRTKIQRDEVLFTLWRTDSDLLEHCQLGHSLGIRGFLGLYQELGHLSIERENRSA